MNNYRADIHIHTVLSPCGDIDMSPINIVNKAVSLNLDIIGITDHNSTLHCELIRKIGEKHKLFVLMGAEVTTKEEVHCLAFFEDSNSLKTFQQYLEEYLPPIVNDVDKFGYQVVVDENEDIIDQVEYLLISGINQSIDQVERKVHELDGLFIPAHIDKKSTSLISQLGFIPPDLKADALEISHNWEKSPEVVAMAKMTNLPLITNSDAHFIEQIGKQYTIFSLNELSYKGIKEALISKSVKPMLN
ncbi:MAG: PHP-associated domain-containing protein [Bacteroidales bacterium]|jgi:PHP family Zn ribbon phosphoesterase